MNAQWNAPISDRFSSLCARVFSPAAAILESEKTLGTRLAKLRSQISRRADDSYPVFARPVWHAGHADREAIWVWHARHAGHKIGMPSMTDFDVRSGTIS